jgi:hypothetical protein
MDDWCSCTDKRIRIDLSGHGKEYPTCKACGKNTLFLHKTAHLKHFNALVAAFVLTVS